MKRRLISSTFALVAFASQAQPALAHHLMGGKTPATFTEGLLSGLGHPVIGLDHFAAVVAVGCLAAAHRAAGALAVGFVLAMIVGVALHLHGATMPGGEILVALSVIVLGAIMLRAAQMPAGATLALFAGVGLLHGYAFGESIYGAEPTPLYAYLAGLAVIQTLVALAAAATLRFAARSKPAIVPLRLAGAAIFGVGLSILVEQIAPRA